MPTSSRKAPEQSKSVKTPEPSPPICPMKLHLTRKDILFQEQQWSYWDNPTNENDWYGSYERLVNEIRHLYALIRAQYSFASNCDCKGEGEDREIAALADLGAKVHDEAMYLAGVLRNAAKRLDEQKKSDQGNGLNIVPKGDTPLKR